MRVLIAVLAACAALAPEAWADVRALAPGGGGIALDGERVLWSADGSVLAAPVAGGSPATLAPFAADTLAAGPGLVAATRGAALYAGLRAVAPELDAPRHAGGFARLRPDLGDPPPFPVVPAVQVSDLGLVTLEDGEVWLRSGERRVEVALPPGADPEHVAVAGRLGVAPVPEGALVVFDLRSGAEVRQISVGALDPVNPDGLALSPSGDVAATLPVGDGTGVLAWAPAGAERVRVLARGQRLGRVATAAGRIAYVSGAGLREGVRAVVADAGGRTLFRAPAAYDVSALAFDGRRLALATPSCLLLASSSAARIPAGPCARTDVAVERLRGGRRVRVACINAPARTCRVRASARGRSVVARVTRGRAREVVVPPGRLTVRTIDPDGRERIVL